MFIHCSLPEYRFNPEVSKSLKTYLGEAPEVKTIGASNQVKITTKYKVADNDPNVDNEVDSLIYLGVKPFMANGANFSDFQHDYKQSSIKIGPTIAHDIKRDAYIAVFFALVVILFTSLSGSVLEVQCRRCYRLFPTTR